jgi:hypothetical protein
MGETEHNPVEQEEVRAQLEEVVHEKESSPAQEKIQEFNQLRERRGIIHMPEDMLRDVLKVPDDVHIYRIEYDNMFMAFKVLLISERFEKVPDYVEAPILQSEVKWDPEAQKIKVEFLYPERKDEDNG